MTTDTRTTRQIEHIAALIAESWDPRNGDASPADYAAKMNAEGWTIDVTYGHEGPGNWTRTEDLRLSEADLARAVELAESLGA